MNHRETRDLDVVVVLGHDRDAKRHRGRGDPRVVDAHPSASKVERDAKAGPGLGDAIVNGHGVEGPYERRARPVDTSVGFPTGWLGVGFATQDADGGRER